jgi:ketosteroid isomerase-like protein
MTQSAAEIKALLDSRSDYVRIKDIDRLMSLYSPDVVYFDVVPGLQFAGSDALRDRFLQWFDSWKGPIGMEICDSNILASGDTAVAYMLNRTSGTLKNGRDVGHWVRATVCCQRSNYGWLIKHEHISLPIDFDPTWAKLVRSLVDGGECLADVVG